MESLVAGQEKSEFNRKQRPFLSLVQNLSRTSAVVRVASIVVTIGVWEWFGRQIDPLFFSYPTAIAAAIPNMIRTGELQSAAVLSLRSLSVGFLLSTILGIGLGLLMGRYRTLNTALDSQLTALYATPYVTLIPLIILWFGLGFEAKVVIVVLASVFPLLINTRDGVRNVSKNLIEIARAEKANERQVFTKIILPASTPQIMTGIRLGIGRAIVGMIVGEMFTAITGLGGAIVYYGNQFRTDKLLVIVIVLALFATALTETAKIIENRVAAWKQTERGV